MSSHDEDRPMERSEAEVSRLFAEYREALPDAEGSVEFMPRLWQRIEARQSTSRDLKRLAQGFVTAAAAVSLVMGIFLALPQGHQALFYNSTYLEILASDQEQESVADVDLVRTEQAAYERSR